MTLVEIQKKEVIGVGEAICHHYTTMFLNYKYDVIRTVNAPNDPYKISPETISAMTITFANNIILEWNVQEGYTLFENNQIVKKERNSGILMGWLEWGDADNQW
jgi:hypothetical protein